MVLCNRWCGVHSSLFLLLSRFWLFDNLILISGLVNTERNNIYVTLVISLWFIFFNCYLLSRSNARIIFRSVDRPCHGRGHAYNTCYTSGSGTQDPGVSIWRRSTNHPSRTGHRYRGLWVFSPLVRFPRCIKRNGNLKITCSKGF